MYTPSNVPVMIHAECWAQDPKAWLMLVVKRLVQGGVAASPECVRLVRGHSLLDVNAQEWGEVDLVIEILADPDPAHYEHRLAHRIVSDTPSGRAKVSCILPPDVATLGDDAKVEWLYYG